MSSCHSFFPVAKKNQRHFKDHTTAIPGSRSFSGTFSSCNPLYICDLSHSKKHHLMRKNLIR